MGRQDEKALHRPFTTDDVKNKSLVIKMLEFEEEFSKSDEGQTMYKNPLNKPYTSLVVEKAINRITLDKFGFDTSDESVENYRRIFRTYYRSPDDYDKDVINSVHYMRENKCMFYKKPIINVGDKIPNCTLVERDGKTKTSLYDAIKKGGGNYTVFAAFSLSWPPFLARLNRLLTIKGDLEKHNLKVILIQIDEAHSSAWPRGLPDQPEPQKDFEERVQKANDFVKLYDVQYPVYVDQWNNEFAELFQAWPDKYYCIDSDLKVIGKAEYGTGTKEALVLKDYTVLLQELMEN